MGKINFDIPKLQNKILQLTQTDKGAELPFVWDLNNFFFEIVILFLEDYQFLNILNTNIVWRYGQCQYSICDRDWVIFNSYRVDSSSFLRPNIFFFHKK